MRTRRLPIAAAALAAVLAGCQAETREIGRDAASAAERGGWNVSGPGGGLAAAAAPAPEEGADAPALPPGDYVEVPAEAWRPLDAFFDSEGYILGDRIEIDCSRDPFKDRLTALSYDHSVAYVVREEWKKGDVYYVRLRNEATGIAYQPNLIPLVTFGSRRLPPPPPVDPATGRPVKVQREPPRPFFEFVATEEILVRFHATSSPDRPVWFQARAVGTPNPVRPSEIRPAIYRNISRGRPEVKGEQLVLDLALRRGSDGAWGAVVRDPEPSLPGTGGR
jgi:predicted small secreted protein